MKALLTQYSDYSSDSGDDEPMMVGSDDQFSNLDMVGTTPLILLFIRAGIYKIFPHKCRHAMP